MKFIAQGAAVLALATGVAATPKAVSVLQPQANLILCDGNMLDRAVLQKDCGHSEAEACPILVAELGNAGIPDVDCGQTMRIKGMDSTGYLQTDNVIFGVVWGHSSDLLGGTDPDFMITPPVLKALCPLPCYDEINDVYTCPSNPSDCQAGVAKPVAIVVGSENVIVSQLSLTGSLLLNYDFGAATGPQVPPLAGDVTGDVVVAGLGVDAWEILEGDAIDCGTAAADLYTEAEAHMSASCGGDVSQPPCPMGANVAGEAFGSCFDDAVNECLQVTFYTEGLTDSVGVFCTNGGCDSNSVSKRFRLVKDTLADGPVHLPLGAWGDICPHTCEAEETGTTVISGVCAAAGECVSNAADTPVVGGNWNYSQLGSQAAKIHYVSHTVVDCAISTTEEPSSSEPDGSSGATSGAQRQIVGGLTALFVATAAVYNL